MTLRVLSLGAGVQSSALLLMADEGRFGVKPDVAIFADTGDEPAYVYEHLARLSAAVSILVETVSAGRLSDDLRRGIETGSRIAQPPLYTKNPKYRRVVAEYVECQHCSCTDGHDQHLCCDCDGSNVVPIYQTTDEVIGYEAAPLRRICTREYKVDVITREIRKKLGYVKGQRIPVGAVEQWFGISLDEAAMRMRTSNEAWIVNVYPLVTAGLDRLACEKYLRDGGWTVKKSACRFCPYKSDSAWRDLRDNHPGEWAQAVEFDRMIRRGLPGVQNEAFVHRSLKPLDEVDLTTLEDHGQMSFLADCESGVCGV